MRKQIIELLKSHLDDLHIYETSTKSKEIEGLYLRIAEEDQPIKFVLIRQEKTNKLASFKVENEVWLEKFIQEILKPSFVS